MTVPCNLMSEVSTERRYVLHLAMLTQSLHELYSIPFNSLVVTEDVFPCTSLD